MTSEFTIDLHTHTVFSDGHNSPYRMALRTKEFGHTALVITDHFYVNSTDAWCSINTNKMQMLRRLAREAKEILPVIIGIELTIGGEEVLVFGTEMVNRIIESTEFGIHVDIPTICDWKKELNSAFILCHPSNHKYWDDLLHILDGYEMYNSGQCCFKFDRDLGCLKGLPGWCNSDSHHVATFRLGHNVVDTKIEDESTLIDYIRSGKQPGHVVTRIHE